MIIIKERNHFLVIKANVSRVFPEFSEGAATHAANKICNNIKASHMDCYCVDVARDDTLDDDGYYRHFAINVSDSTVYVRITVD